MTNTSSVIQKPHYRHSNHNSLELRLRNQLPALAICLWKVVSENTVKHTPIIVIIWLPPLKQDSNKLFITHVTRIYTSTPSSNKFINSPYFNPTVDAHDGMSPYLLSVNADYKAPLLTTFTTRTRMLLSTTIHKQKFCNPESTDWASAAHSCHQRR